MMDTSPCRCLFGPPVWTEWQPSMWGGVTETRYCRRCAHPAYRPLSAPESVVDAPQDAPKPQTHVPARERSKPAFWATVGANKARAKAWKEREQ